MGTKKNKRVFSESFKRGKVRQIERGETTRSEVCRLYGVSSGLAHSWIEKYRIRALRGAIFHTDNGSQYEAGEVLALLEHLHVVVSRAKDCQQNGSAEQLNNLVKNQYLEHWSPHSFQDLEKACRKLTRLHNHERAIPQLGNISPVEFERRLASIPLDQRPIKKMHEFN